MEKNTLEHKSSDFLDPDKVEEISSTILEMAQKKGASQAEVSVNFDKGFSVSTRLEEVETVEFNQDKSFSVTVYFGNRRGGATSSDTSLSSLKQLVDRACDIAKASDEDPCFGLAEPELLATNFPDLQLDYPWMIDAQQAIELAKECEHIALNKDSRIVNSDGCSISSYQFLRSYATSTGFNHSFRASRHSKSCVLLAKDSQGLKQDYDYTTARDPQKLLANELLAEKATERTLARLNAQKISTQKCPVIFAHDVSNTVLGSFISAISGSNIYQKSSFLLDQIGKQIFPSKYHIQEKPYEIGALGSSAYDLEGVQTRNNCFVESGILQHYLLDCYSARRLDLSTTANAGGVHNLSITDDGCNFDELLQEMGTGLVVTSLMGSAISLVTGDYSRGASGFWVEGGKVQYPVDEITIASNLRDMFSNILMIANDVDPRKSTKCGSILISEMMVAGK